MYVSAGVEAGARDGSGTPGVIISGRLPPPTAPQGNRPRHATHSHSGRARARDAESDRRNEISMVENLYKHRLGPQILFPELVCILVVVWFVLLAGWVLRLQIRRLTQNQLCPA